MEFSDFVDLTTTFFQCGRNIKCKDQSKDTNKLNKRKI